VLPDSYHSPTHPSKFAEISTIAFTISAYLLFPEIIKLVLPDRQSIAMPKIPINKDGDLLSREDSIRSTWQSLDVFPESVASFVQFGPDDYFKAAIPQLYVRHRAKALLWSTRVRRLRLCQRSFECARPFPVVQDSRHSFAARV